MTPLVVQILLSDAFVSKHTSVFYPTVNESSLLVLMNPSKLHEIIQNNKLSLGSIDNFKTRLYALNGRRQYLFEGNNTLCALLIRADRNAKEVLYPWNRKMSNQNIFGA